MNEAALEMLPEETFDQWLDKMIDENVVYRTINLFARDRFIYFFSVTPHLVKTVRNCLYSSCPDENYTRQMWKDGDHLMWQHINNAYNKDSEKEIRYLNKLTLEHIKLTPYSKMRVSLAAQVLSSSMSKILRKDFPEYKETSNLFEFMDGFFDCLNVRSTNEGKFTLKPNLLPYRCSDDSRLKWLIEHFLGFFKD